MRIRIDQPTVPGDDKVITPVNPPPLIDISSLFELEIFEATSTSSAPPFAQLAVNWKIKPINRTTNIEDYQFRLVVFDHIQLNGLQAEGSAPFTLLGSTRAMISGRKNGGRWSAFDKDVIISLDKSNCQTIEHYGPFIDAVVYSKLNELLSDHKELRLREELVPANPQNPNGPQKLAEEPSSDWTISRIRYNFPLEIVLENFFNADLDVRMDISFKIEHDQDGSNVDINAEFKVDASFDTGEHILSSAIPFLGASTVAIQKTLDKVLPIVFDCRKSEIETAIASGIIDDRVKAALNNLQDGRIYAIQIDPAPQGGRNNNLYVIVCQRSFETEGDENDTGGVVVRV